MSLSAKRESLSRIHGRYTQAREKAEILKAEKLVVGPFALTVGASVRGSRLVSSLARPKRTHSQIFGLDPKVYGPNPSALENFHVKIVQSRVFWRIFT
jgi:hypothetical protein